MFSAGIFIANRMNTGLAGSAMNILRKAKVISTEFDKRNKITDKEYHFKTGILSEKLLYVFDESTIVQKEFLDYRL